MDDAAVTPPAEPYRQLARAPNGCIVHTCLFETDQADSAKPKFMFCRMHWSAIPMKHRKELRALRSSNFKAWYDMVTWLVRVVAFKEQPLTVRIRFSEGNEYDTWPGHLTPDNPHVVRAATEAPPPSP